MRGFFSLDAFGTFFSVDFDTLDDLALYCVTWSHYCTLLHITATVGQRQTGPDFVSWADSLATAWEVPA